MFLVGSGESLDTCIICYFVSDLIRCANMPVPMFVSILT